MLDEALSVHIHTCKISLACLQQVRRPLQAEGLRPQLHGGGDGRDGVHRDRVQPGRPCQRVPDGGGRVPRFRLGLWKL